MTVSELLHTGIFIITTLFKILGAGREQSMILVTFKKTSDPYMHPDTHGNKSLTIPAIAYFINSLHGQSSVRDRGEPTYLYIGDVSYKTINYN